MKALDVIYFLFSTALIQDFAPAEIRSDQDLMLMACTRSHQILDVVDDRLAGDHAFLSALADRNPCILKSLSHELQRSFPDVVDRVFKHGSEGGEFITLDYCSSIVGAADNLAPEFWSNRDFLLCWFQLGFPFLDIGPFLQPDWKADKEIFLLVAKHCCFGHRLSFEASSMSLRRDKQFMLQVLELGIRQVFVVIGSSRITQ